MFNQLTILAAAEQFTTIDHLAIVATFLLVVFLILFGFWGRYGGPR